jgi:hypothetical protein
MRPATFASCEACDDAVVTSNGRCPWCDGEIVPPERVEFSMQRAMESTLLVQLVIGANS